MPNQTLPAGFAFSGATLIAGVVYVVLVLTVVTFTIVALWRGMRAQERAARHLENIEQLLRERGIP
jgi:uncharacterized membrane protein